MPRKQGRTHVNIVTALFGTVRMRLIESPLYRPRQPSKCRIFLTVPTTPERLRGGMLGSMRRRCVWRRVRMTSCGYVAIDAIIFDVAEQSRMTCGGRGMPLLRRSCDRTRRGNESVKHETYDWERTYARRS